MIINGKDNIRLSYDPGECSAVLIAIENLAADLLATMDVTCAKEHAVTAAIHISCNEEALPREGFSIRVVGQDLYIKGHDRRGTIYGIYTVSSMLGVSPWYWFADVPPKKRASFELREGFYLVEAPHVAYRGIFINDEEELDAWAREYMHEETIGVKTYEKIFELLLRLKLNYIWPAMHVNSFNLKPENGALAEKMGIVVGTSHCDMLMRSNNREWGPWKKANGFENAVYDWSVSDENRKILKKYWGDSVIQNRDFEVSFTLGMRGIHDSGFETRALDRDMLSEEELRSRKTELLHDVINAQEEILKENGKSEDLKLFIPYKEVLDLYDNGLEVPEDITLVWVNDNYGFIRRFPNEEEKNRQGGNGIYFHNSYWAPPGNSYMFINTIPLAHTGYELTKAWKNGIGKLWVTNFGTIKPHEIEMSYYADLAWETGTTGPKTDDVDEWLSNWLRSNFTLEKDVSDELAGVLNGFDQLTNTRKVEFLDSDVFPLNAFGDEGGHRILEYVSIFEKINGVYESLPKNEKDAFFQMILMKVHAAYYSNAMFYFADRSYAAAEKELKQAAMKYTIESLGFDRLRRKMLYYYNHVMSGGKWNRMLTPEDFPPPRTSMFPACRPPIATGKPGIVVSIWGNGEELTFSSNRTKWIEIGNTGPGTVRFEILAPEWLRPEVRKGTVSDEKRILIENTADMPCTGLITVICPDTKEKIKIPVKTTAFSRFEDDHRMLFEADDFDDLSDGARLCKRLGRDHGALLSLECEDARASCRFDVNADIVYGKLYVHRFPSLNSTGRIRARVMIDNETYVYEAEAVDERTANWKANVQNYGDLGNPIRVRLTKGQHTLTVKAIDPWFAFSRIVIFTEKETAGNLDISCYGEDIPAHTDTEKLGELLYGTYEIHARREIFATMADYRNANEDYDRYEEREPDVPLAEWEKTFNRTYPTIIRSAECILPERFEAACAILGTDFASIVNSEKGKITYCNSDSHGGTGIALYMREKGLHFGFSDSPVLNYRFKISEKGRYVMWLKLFMWGNDESRFEPVIDGKRYTRQMFVRPKLWTYSSEHVWKWYPVTENDLSAGAHTLSIHILDSGLRIDAIKFEKGEEQK